MVPYYETKSPRTGELVREFWPTHVASQKLREIKGGVVKELRAKDETLLAQLRQRDPDEHRLNGYRHPAAEMIDETNERWWKFCSTPQPIPAGSTEYPKPKKINRPHPMTQQLSDAARPSDEIRETASSRFPESEDTGKSRKRI